MYRVIKNQKFIPKLLLRLLLFLRRTAALFHQIRTFPQLFRFCSDLGNPGIRQIVRDSILTGCWWEGRILINLCGNNNVRNCDLLQSDFFARVGPSWGSKGIFLACVVQGVPGNFFPWLTCRKVANQAQPTKQPTPLLEKRNVWAFFPKKIDFWAVLGSQKKKIVKNFDVFFCVS